MQRGHLEELRHKLLGVNAALDVNGNAQTRQVRFVADVHNLAHFTFLGKLHNAVDDHIGFCSVRNFVHLNDALFGQVTPTRANLETARARFVHALQLGAAVHDLATRGEIRCRQRFE